MAILIEEIWEPVRLPPANLAEEAELEEYIAANHLNQWVYTGRKLYSSGTVTITGIDAGMVNARRKNVFGAWPLPPPYVPSQWPRVAPVNAVSVQQSPP